MLYLWYRDFSKFNVKHKIFDFINYYGDRNNQLLFYAFSFVLFLLMKSWLHRINVKLG